MNLKKKNLPVHIILLSISFIVLIIRARFGFCWSDETFYISTTHRFFTGDSIFYNEWFPTQLSSLCLLPFHALFVFISGGTTGIVLYFRILYVFFETICAYTTYYVIKKHHSAFIATAAMMFVMFYSHLNIATLSYYTMSVLFFLLTMLFIYDVLKSECTNNNKELILAGFCFAISVLNLPTLVIVYFLLVFLLAVTLIVRKISSINVYNTVYDKINPVRIFVISFIGIVIPASIFAIYTLLTVKITDFINAIPYVLSDDEHELSAIYPIKKMYLSLNESYMQIAKICYLLIAISVIFFLLEISFSILNSRANSNNITKLIKDKSYVIESMFNKSRIILFIADVCMFVACLYKSYSHTGYTQTALMLFGLVLFLISKERNYKAFVMFYISGLTFSLVYSYSSNGMLYVLSIGHFIASIGCLLIISDFTKQDENNKLIKYIPAAIVCICVIITATLRITNIYRDDKLEKLNSMIDKGPGALIYTNEDHLEKYNNVYNTITEKCQSNSYNSENKTLLVSNLLPYAYLLTDLKVAAPTVWRNPMGSERLKEYYEVIPERIPDIIFKVNEEYGTYETCGDVEYDPTPNMNDSDGYIYDLIKELDYKKEVTDCGIVYHK